MKAFLLVVGFWLSSSASHASTFIGNGGNAGDVEILVTKKQLNETLRLTEASREVSRQDTVEDDRGLCTCAEDFDNHPICSYLKELTQEQRKYCEVSLVERIETITDLLDTRSATAVSFTWAPERISVREGTSGRGVDGVANREARTITLDQERFLDMVPYERLFLLTHELLHFTDLDGKPLSDEGVAGPFNGKDGGRRFINSMAAAVVMEAADRGVIAKYRGALRRPQGWLKRWVDLDAGSSSFTAKPSDTFAMETFSRTGAAFRYYFSALGAKLSIKNYSAKQSILTSIKGEESVVALGAGVTYRLFPVRDPLTFWGQSHFVFDVLAERVSAKYKLTDPSNDLDASADAWGGSLACSYFMPLVWNLWLSLGGSYEIHPYSYSRPKVNYDKHKLSSYVGVSYAF